MSLDGVAVVSLDVESMYNNMSEDLATSAVKDYLDSRIYQEDGKLKTNIYVKPSNKQLYLDFHSNHPDHCKNAIPYSQALRVVEKCSDKETMDTELIKLEDKFIERNYPKKLVEEKFEQVENFVA